MNRFADVTLIPLPPFSLDVPLVLHENQYQNR